MTNLHTLSEAFTELERRADAVTAGGAAASLPSRPRRQRRLMSLGRLVPVAATAAVVVGLVVGVMLLAPNDPDHMPVGAPPGQTSPAVPPASAPGAAEPALPGTPEQLIERFEVVLGTTATFEVTETGPGASVMTMPSLPTGQPNASTEPVPSPGTTEIGAYIGGTLTAAGATGGFDLLAYQSDDTATYHCPDGDLGERECTERELPDGSRLIIDNTPLQVPGGRTYGVDFHGSDGTRISMHVSNLRNPKGPAGSPRLADQPPLSLDQMIAIVTSDLW